MVSGRRVGRMLLSVALALAAPAALAQAVIESVQYPAWLERAGETAPLMPGTVLQARDVIATGSDGRARIRLAEGSRMRLGENARAVLRRDEVAVDAGAFRFTAGSSRGLEVALRIAGMPVFCRGADLWGRGGDSGIVILIAGEATVAIEGRSPLALVRPLDRVEARLGAGPVMSQAIADELAQGTRGVEMHADGARAEAGGRWRVLVGKFESGRDARTLADQTRAAGFPAEVQGGGGRPHVVVVPGFVGETEARAAMARLRSVPGSGILTIFEGAAGR